MGIPSGHSIEFYDGKVRLDSIPVRITLKGEFMRFGCTRISVQAIEEIYLKYKQALPAEILLQEGT